MAGRRAATQVIKTLRQSVGSNAQFRTVVDSHLPAVVIPRLSAPFQPQLTAGHKHVEQRAFSSRQLHSEAQSAKDDEDTNKYEHSKMNDEGGGSVLNFHEKAAEIKEGASETVGGVNAENVKDKAGEEVDSAKDMAENVKDKAGEEVDSAKDMAENVKDKAGEQVDSAKDMAENVKDGAGQELDKAKDVTKETKDEVTDTATELKDVAVEAVKAVGRDVGKVAEKVGLTKQNLSDVKDVGVEARKAAGRDAAKVAEKVGVSTESVSQTATDVKEVGVEAGKAVGRDAGKVAEKAGLKSDKN